MIASVKALPFRLFVIARHEKNRSTVTEDEIPALYMTKTKFFSLEVIFGKSVLMLLGLLNVVAIQRKFYSNFIFLLRVSL